MDCQCFTRFGKIKYNKMSGKNDQLLFNYLNYSKRLNTRSTLFMHLLDKQVNYVHEKKVEYYSSF